MMSQMPPTYSPESVMSSIQQMAEQSTDPMKRMLAQMALSKMQESKSSVRERPVAQDTQKMRQDIQQLIQMNRGLMEDVKALQNLKNQVVERNQVMASSLGACTCWGFDPTCGHCNGNGIPGTQEVNTEYFQQLILPFFQKIIDFPAVKEDDPSS